MTGLSCKIQPLYNPLLLDMNLLPVDVWFVFLVSITMFAKPLSVRN